MSSSDSWCLVGLVLEPEVGGDGAVDLADEVPFEAADDHLVGASLGEASFHVGLGRLVPPEAADDDDVECPVGVAITRRAERDHPYSLAFEDGDFGVIPALLGYSRAAAIRQSGWMPTGATADWSDDHQRDAATRGSP
jgi:hypothetical protein